MASVYSEAVEDRRPIYKDGDIIDYSHPYDLHGKCNGSFEGSGDGAVDYGGGYNGYSDGNCGNTKTGGHRSCGGGDGGDTIVSGVGGSSGNADQTKRNPSPISAMPHQNEYSFSMGRVKIVLFLIVTLSSAGFATKTIIAQYLLDRWSDESGHSRTHNQTDVAVSSGGALCDKNESDPWVIQEDDIQSKVSMAMMYYSLATSLPALVACLIYGSLVDIVGRRLPLLSSLVGTTAQAVVVLIIIIFQLDPNFFYLAYAVDGIGGSFFVNLIASFSITADISREKGTRILGIAILTVVGASAYAGVNVMVGLLIKKVGYIAATSSVMGPEFLSLLIAAVLLPETLPMQRQRATLRRIWDYTKRVVFLYTRDGEVRKRRSLAVCLLIFFFSVINVMNVGNIDTLYQKLTPLCWNAAQLGYYQATRNSGGYILGLIWLCIYRCIGCASDEVLAMVGMLFVAGGFVLEALVVNSWQMYMVPLLMSPGVNIAPIIRGLMSVLVGPKKQGVMFSSIAIIESLCNLTANVAYNKIYAVTVDFFPGFVYLVMAGTSLTTFFLFIPFFYYYDGPPRPNKYERVIQATEETTDDSEEISTSYPQVENA